MNRISSVFLATVNICVLAACASNAEIQQGKKNAFDLAGEYRTTPTSDQKMQITVVNRSSRSDITASI